MRRVVRLAAAAPSACALFGVLLTDVVEKSNVTRTVSCAGAHSAASSDDGALPHEAGGSYDSDRLGAFAHRTYGQRLATVSWARTVCWARTAA